MLLGARASDVIWYYKTDDKKKVGVSINLQEIGICKYKELLMATVKDTLEMLVHSFDITNSCSSACGHAIFFFHH
jgi:hypothetical protein